MSRYVKNTVFGILALLVSGIMVQEAHALAYGDSAATPANTEITNGWWDGSGAAVLPGEMSIQIGNVYAGVHSDSTRDTMIVDSVYAFSSLESLLVADQNAGNYDTIFYQYIIQNYGNVASDSFGILVNIIDTTNTTTHFPVNDLDVVTDTAGSDNVVSWATGGGAVDSVYYGLKLAEGAYDTFFIRVVVPRIDSATDGDNIDIAVMVTDQAGTATEGDHDYWPDTLGGAYHTSARIVVDTVGTYLHTGVVSGIDSCLLDFGDTQYDTVRLSIAAATVRLAKTVTKVGWTYAKPKPGDTLQYTIKYDNDGSGATVDPAYIVDQLPPGVSFVEIDSMVAGNDSTISVEASYRGGAWSGTIANDEDSLRLITALRFTVSSGLNGNVGGDNQSSVIADDSTGHDAGLIRFKVRVR